jgi:hypothetical protein
MGEPLRGMYLAMNSSSCFSAAGFVERGGLHLVDESAAAMGALVPGVHGVEHGVALVNDEHGTVDACRQVGAGDHHGDFEQKLFFRVQAAHFAVQPDQVLVASLQGGHGGRGCRV